MPRHLISDAHRGRCYCTFPWCSRYGKSLTEGDGHKNVNSVNTLGRVRVGTEVNDRCIRPSKSVTNIKSGVLRLCCGYHKVVVLQCVKGVITMASKSLLQNPKVARDRIGSGIGHGGELLGDWINDPPRERDDGKSSIRYESHVQKGSGLADHLVIFVSKSFSPLWNRITRE